MLITILAGAFILSVVIIVHEFGHFIVAKKSGVFVKTFSIGFGRKVLKKRVGETQYAISLLPFGGYVKFAGEHETEGDSDGSAAPKEAPQGDTTDEIPDSEIDPERYFKNKRPLIRSAVVFAGPFFNYVLAVVVCIGMLAFYGVQVIPTTRIGEVVPGSPADSAGLRVNDRIVAVDGEPVNNSGDLNEALLEEIELPKTLTVARDGERIDLRFTVGQRENGFDFGFYLPLPPRMGRVKHGAPAYRAGMREGAVIEAINDTTIASYDDLQRIIHANPEVPLVIRWSLDNVSHVDTIVPQAKKVPKDDSLSEFEIIGQIGVAPSYERKRMPVTRSVSSGFLRANSMVSDVVRFLKLLVTRRVPVRESLGGPILITQMAGDMARWGFDYLLYLLAFISVSLCIFNLLPILPFDGGHLVLFFYEGTTRRRVPRRLREILTQAGFVLLLVLMVFVVLLDLSRCAGPSPGLF